MNGRIQQSPGSLRHRTNAFLVALAAILAAQAPEADAQDQVGVYFDAGFATNEFETLVTPLFLTGYLVLLDPSAAAGVGGWELCADIEGPAQFVSWLLEGQTINTDPPPCFTVGIGGPPLPAAATVLLATFQMVVEETQPVTISLKPQFHPSIPGSMAYLDGADPNVIIPLTTTTGMPEVAFINRDVPVPDITPQALQFGEVLLGTQETLSVFAHNAGGGVLQLDVTLPDSCQGFALSGVSGPLSVPAGQTLTIPVLFTPPDTLVHQCVLSLGPGVRDLFMMGKGREALVDWSVSPAAVSFGEVMIGNTQYRDVTIFNLGETVIRVEAGLAAAGSSFTIATPINPRDLNPGDLMQVRVFFSPVAPGLFADTLLLGGVIPPVPVDGEAREPFTSYSLTPTSLLLADMAVGSTASAEIALVNLGETTLSLAPYLLDPDPGWAIQSGGRPGNLAPFQSRTMTVTFIATGLGTFEATLVIGPQVAQVPLLAQVGDPVLACAVSPSYLDMGTMPLGQDLASDIVVHNTGNFRLLIAPTTSACYLYDIDTTAFILDPGEQRLVHVDFHADAVGQWTCSVNLGQSVCGGVYLTATVYPNPDQTDQYAGVFFDQAYRIDQASTSTLDETLTGYLVLKNASNASGVAGWECCLDLAGDAWFLDWQVEGQHLNLLVPPCFLVGIGGSPLPYSPAILLATFTMGVLTPASEVTVLLGPTSEPSLPGSSAWIPWDDLNLLLPMQRSPGGFLPVAVVNNQVLGVQAPTPQAEVAGGGVTLSWELAGVPADGCHVYRRLAGQEPQRLTATPLAPLGNSFTYSDPLTAMTAGSILYYSYAVIRDGRELARSPEVMVTFGEVPGISTGLTRLLPNVPNPFNPQTEVRFELAEAGRARLSIYDVSGRRVCTLVDESLGAGPQARIWQGRDDAGRPMPSGAYYLRLETDGRIDHRMVLLLK